ncbi:LPS export ABC transporter permease LptF [Frigidibacter oleivorans]|uniref:LPS export ABC transporter permease LptF n=1 Tax=Frigidibacter oleivorans TaxID=2487129 RepID=UPI001F282AFE
MLALFGFFSLILVSVYWVNQAVQIFEQLIADGQTAWVFLEFSALTLPNVIRMVLPVSAFVATVYTTNRLSQESELVVMQAVGLSPWRLARPALVFGLIVAGLLSVLTHVLVPGARAELADRRAEIAENVTAQFLTAGSFQHPASGITLYIRDISPAGELLDIYIADARNPGESTTYTAERALLVRSETGPKLVMFEGMAQVLTLADDRLQVTRFADSTYDIGALLSPSARQNRDLREFSTPRLLAAAPDDLDRADASPAEFLAEGHARFAHPLIAAAFAAIGFSALLTGSFSRFGIWRQIALAIVALVVVQAAANAVDSAAQQDPRLWPLVYLPPALGGMIAALFLGLAGRARRVAPPDAAPPQEAAA